MPTCSQLSIGAILPTAGPSGTKVLLIISEHYYFQRASGNFVQFDTGDTAPIHFDPSDTSYLSNIVGSPYFIAPAGLSGPHSFVIVTTAYGGSCTTNSAIFYFGAAGGASGSGGGATALPSYTFDPLTNQVLTWTFTPSTTGDVQTAFEVVVHDAAGNILWDTGEVFSGTASYTLPAGALPDVYAIDTWTVRVWNLSGIPSGYASPGTLTLHPNRPPLAPTLTLNGALDTIGIIPISWLFRDPDQDWNASEHQTAYQAVLLDHGTGATVWDSGKVTSTNNWALVPSGIPVSGHYYDVKVRTWDSTNLVGPYSAVPTSASLIQAFDPPVITIDVPADGSTVLHQRQLIEWFFTSSVGHPMAQYSITLYDVQTTPPATTLIWTTGVLTVADAPPFDLTTGAFGSHAGMLYLGWTLVNGHTYLVTVEAYDSYGVPGRASTVFTAAFVPAAQPTLTVTPDAANGRIRIDVATNQ